MRGRCLILDKASYGRAGARAWLKLYSDERTGALAWMETTARQAVEDRATWKQLDPPSKANVKAVGVARPNGRTYAPGELGP